MFHAPSKHRHYRGRRTEDRSPSPEKVETAEEKKQAPVEVPPPAAVADDNKEKGEMAPPPRPLEPKREETVSEEELRLRRRNEQRQKREEQQLKELLQGGGSDDEWEAATPLKSIHVRTNDKNKHTGEETGRNNDRHQGSRDLVQPTPNRYSSHSRVSLVDDDDTGTNNLLLDSSDEEFYATGEGQLAENPDSQFRGDEELLKKKEASYRRAMGDKKIPRLSARQSALQLDQEKWENDRLQASGVLVSSGGEMEEMEEQRDVLIVRNMKPPFLDGDVHFTRQTEMVSTVKDPTSDFAKLARSGSAVLKAFTMEENKRKQIDKDRFWELQGSKMGKLMGLRQLKSGGTKDDIQTDEEVKAENSYAAHMSSEGSSEFSKTKTIKEQREYLPIFSVREELMNVIRENQIVVIVGETGSGKTTQLTQYLFEDGYARDGVVGCTQPRRVAASSVAKRVADERGCKVGELVGYSIRFEDVTSEATKIKYMTDGILLHETMSDPLLQQYSVIIMDEAHERSLNTDVLFGIMKKVLKERSDLKLIVTSATMNSERFSDFFGGVPIFTIPGRTFPVQTFYQKSPCDDYVDAVVNQIITIHLAYDPGDILVFMTGQNDIECVCEMVNEKINRMEKKCDPLLVLPMYSLQSAAKQSLVFAKTPEGMRKCVVCTNIAETSLTVDGIRYVIDSGYCKLKVFNPSIGMDALQVTPVSKANADQRKGRAGRTGPGMCFRMYTEQMYETETLQNQVPEIQRTNISNIVLLLKKLGVENLYEFDFMDPPPQEIIANSMYQLWVLGALTNTGALSELGERMVDYPLDPYLQKMMVMGEKYGCTAEIAVIVAMLSVPNIFDKPPEKQEEADSVHSNFSVPESDHLTYLNIFLQWKRAKYSKSWCERNYLHARSLARVRNVRNQILEIMKAQKIAHVSCGNNWDVVRKVVCSAYFFNAARIQGIGKYTNMLTGTPCQLHPTSALYGLGYTPDYIVYHELVMTTKEYMRCVTAVEAQWLAELAPMFFSLKEDFQSRLKSKKLEKKQKEEMEREMAEENQRKQEEEKKKTMSVKRNSILSAPGSMIQRGALSKKPRRVGL